MTEETIIVLKRILEQEVKKHYDEASPYTGEYHMGRADLANELLEEPPIDWDAHPRSIQTMIRKSRERRKGRE